MYKDPKSIKLCATTLSCRSSTWCKATLHRLREVVNHLNPKIALNHWTMTPFQLSGIATCLDMQSQSLARIPNCFGLNRRLWFAMLVGTLDQCATLFFHWKSMVVLWKFKDRFCSTSRCVSPLCSARYLNMPWWIMHRVRMLSVWPRRSTKSNGSSTIAPSILSTWRTCHQEVDHLPEWVDHPPIMEEDHLLWYVRQ